MPAPLRSLNVAVDTWRDLAAVAELHLRYLSSRHPADRRTKALLTRYYEVCRDDRDTALITADHRGELVGYLCLISSLPDLYRQLLRKHWHEAIGFALRRLGHHPREMMQEFLQKIMPAIRENILPRHRGKNPLPAATPGTFELRPIVVVPRYQGTGAAPLLLKRGEDYLRSRNLTSYFLRVEAQNQRAFHFYVKSGFQVACRDGNVFLLTKSLP